MTSIGEDAFSSTTEVWCPSGSALPQCEFFCTSTTSCDEDIFSSFDIAANTVVGTCTIPSTFNMVGKGSFVGSTVTSVVMPSSITTVSAYSFQDVSTLVAVELSEGLESIGQFAFNGTSLVAVIIPSTVVSVAVYAFPSSTELDCPLGYALTGILTCGICPLGTFSMGTTECVLCSIGFYSDEVGASSCQACSSGRVTPFAGATSVDDCLSPLPNFVTACLTLSVFIPLFIVYFIRGRVHRVGFLRKQRPLGNVLDEIQILGRSILDAISRHIIAHDVQQKASAAWRLSCFIVFSLLALPCFVILGYFLIVTRCMFNGLLIERGLSVDFPYTQQVERIVQAMNFNMGALHYLMYPFSWALELIDNFKINFDALSVTCSGAQAPLELLINFLITMLLITFIESGVHVTQNVDFIHANKSFIEAVISHDLGLGTMRKYQVLLYAVVIQAFTASDPFLKLLQMCAGLVNIFTFFQSSGIFHDSTTACDKVSSFLLFFFSSFSCYHIFSSSFLSPTSHAFTLSLKGQGDSRNGYIACDDLLCVDVVHHSTYDF